MNSFLTNEVLNSIASQAYGRLVSAEDIFINQGFYGRDPYFVFLKGYQLIVCFLREKPFSLTERESLEIQGGSHFKGHVIRFWQNGSSVEIKNALSEMDFDFDRLDLTTRLQMSMWEWASFACAVLKERLVKAGEEIQVVQTLIMGPPHIVSKNGNHMHFRFVMGFPHGPSLPGFYPDKKLLEAIVSNMEIPDDCSASFSIVYVPIKDLQMDPHDPRFPQFPPVRRSKLGVGEITETAVAKYDSSAVLTIYKRSE
ncbi:MAG: hypothetical protein J0L82_10375 [Deltaproteobacteria bacterium]|nr:hypothetical protein [Deltaproteobacteria bacterium]